MRRKGFLRHLYPSYLAVAVAATLMTSWLGFYYMQSSLREESQAHLQTKALWIQSQLTNQPNAQTAEALLQQIESLESTTETKITVTPISSNVVISSTSGMRTQGTRKWIYVTLPDESSGMVLDVAQPLDHVVVSFGAPSWQGICLHFVISILASLISIPVIRRIGAPLHEMSLAAESFARGQLKRRLFISGPREMIQVAKSLNKMAAMLNERIHIISEQRNEHEAILSSMKEGIFAVDLQQRIISMNQAAGNLLGISPDTILGKPFQTTFQDEDLNQMVAHTLSGNLESIEELVFYQHGEYYLQANGSILRNAAGHGIGALVVLNDVTALHHLETVRQDFVANVSHELKTPIAIIKGAIATILDEDEPIETENRFLQMISKNTDRLDAIIEDLLTLSRLEQGLEEQALEHEMCLIMPILQNALQVCESKAQHHQIEISIDCPETVAAEVNPPLLEQVLINLINNAIQYSQTQKAIDIRAKEEDDQIIIEVQDYGVGIEEEHLSRLFERFYRADKGRHRKSGGTGLGLSIVKHIVQVHHGTIHIESTLGKGSNFVIQLPRHQPVHHIS